ncbi:hypothetical protein CYLTODRAFT_425867 [Cylindrobasidium torrendii FP15055 ss-10]|uniref:F-box domain-containing protein n=1 Tax=Cylindrobasidium torrendii FP15055 ss-10 TaxID=1314674 RepID=A0A0D7AZE5_9AGAR|nr:hypothetical protein CYLTODRAFT_425867 [Cylindrobasidium torrendii FP15055 ss-10]
MNIAHANGDIPRWCNASVIQLLAFATQHARESPLNMVLIFVDSTEESKTGASRLCPLFPALLATLDRWHRLCALLFVQNTSQLPIGELCAKAGNLERLELKIHQLPRLKVITKGGPSLRHVACQWTPDLVLPWGQLIELILEVEDLPCLVDLEACCSLVWFYLRLSRWTRATASVTRIVTLPLVTTFKTNSPRILDMFNLPSVVTLGLEGAAIAHASTENFVHRSRCSVKTLLVKHVFDKDLDRVMTVLPSLTSQIKHLVIHIRQSRVGATEPSVMTVLRKLADPSVATQMETLRIRSNSFDAPMDVNSVLASLSDVVRVRRECKDPLERVFLKISRCARLSEGDPTNLEIPPKLIEWNDACRPIVGIDVEVELARGDKTVWSGLLPNPRGMSMLPAELSKAPCEPSIAPSFNWGD